MTRKKRRNRKKNFSILFIVILIIIISGFIVILSSSSSKNGLKKLKYSDDAILKIIELKIEDKVLKKTYSKTLDVALSENSFVVDNLDYYFKYEYRNDEKFIYNLNKLIELGYNEKEITDIFDMLSSDNIAVLLKHSKVEGISNYIKFSYFKMDFLDRYLTYIGSVNNDYEKCVTYVNIGLDKPFYTDVKTTDKPDDILVLVNKYVFLPSDYEPNDLVTISSKNSQVTVKLRSEAAKKFEELCTDASNIGYSIQGISGYRSYNFQKNLYNNYKASDPKGVDTYSARPGASEHQTGLAMDVATKTTIYTKFGTTKEYLWLKENAHKYGFIIHYTADNTNITGYKKEEWHIRYVGLDVAKFIYENNISFDEYYVRYLDK